MLTSTERSVFGPIRSGLTRGMDEPTLDCPCGEIGRVEVQAQQLDDSCSWTIYHRATRCIEHALVLLYALLSAGSWPHTRIVLVPL